MAPPSNPDVSHAHSTNEPRAHAHPAKHGLIQWMIKRTNTNTKPCLLDWHMKLQTTIHIKPWWFADFEQLFRVLSQCALIRYTVYYFFDLVSHPAQSGSFADSAQGFRPLHSQARPQIPDPTVVVGSTLPNGRIDGRCSVGDPPRRVVLADWWGHRNQGSSHTIQDGRCQHKHVQKQSSKRTGTIIYNKCESKGICFPRDYMRLSPWYLLKGVGDCWWIMVDLWGLRICCITWFIIICWIEQSKTRETLNTKARKSRQTRNGPGPTILIHTLV